MNGDKILQASKFASLQVYNEYDRPYKLKQALLN